jgi:uncharacterized protein YndB with AHSA1/START domain
MSCDEAEGQTEIVIERDIELDAPPEVVWDELPSLFDADADADRVRVVDTSDAPDRLSFWWAPETDDDAPSYVEIELHPTAVGTMLHVRETRLDGAHLVRSVFSARARV